MIDQQLSLLTQTRKNLLEEVNACSLEQLFSIPEKFNNNIIWNIGHLIATFDILIYASSNTQSKIDSSITDSFKKGTFPSQEIDKSLAEKLVAEFTSSVENLKQDYKNQIFGSYTERVTSYGVKLSSVEDAISFCNLHESMHYGQIKMLRRLV